jgi:hypothetical protein
VNTPAHAILNLALLGRGENRAHTAPILAGALLPDFPMFGFYLWNRLFVGASERVIWGDLYFRASWQMLFDLFNSIPLAALGALLAWWAGARGWLLFFASVGLHGLLDLPLHREDAHRHFLPLSGWRFESPVSYWDPAHYGAWSSAFEILAVIAASWVLWRVYPLAVPRVALTLLCTVSVAGWFVFYVFHQC